MNVRASNDFVGNLCEIISLKFQMQKNIGPTMCCIPPQLHFPPRQHSQCIQICGFYQKVLVSMA